MLVKVMNRFFIKEGLRSYKTTHCRSVIFSAEDFYNIHFICLNLDHSKVFFLLDLYPLKTEKKGKSHAPL